MKKLISSVLVGFILIPSNSFGQDIVTKLNENGMYESEIITEIKGKTSSEIYKSTMEWIAYTFRNTESVIQSKIENKMIRLTGISNSVIDGPLNYKYGLGYVIQIDIKEEKIKFHIYDIDFIGADAAKTRSGIEESIIKNGELRKGKMYIGFKSDTDNELNRIYIDYMNFLNKEKDDDW